MNEHFTYSDHETVEGDSLTKNSTLKSMEICGVTKGPVAQGNTMGLACTWKKCSTIESLGIEVRFLSTNSIIDLLKTTKLLQIVLNPVAKLDKWNERYIWDWQ